MANFFIIDHSLKDAGGHHFDYAHCVADAAIGAGYDVVVGANRKFSAAAWGQGIAGESRESPARTEVLPVFRHHTYQKDSYLAGLQHLTRSQTIQAIASDEDVGLAGRLKHQASHFLHWRRREWLVRQFASDCTRFFSGYQQQPGDHAFLTTISELELMGLAIYLSRQPQTMQTHWHLQFHFNLFEGRTPEYHRQSYVADAVSACFMATLSRLAYHSVHFYTTSQTLADQYNALGVGEFHPLPYPIAPQFAHDSSLMRERAKLRVFRGDEDQNDPWSSDGGHWGQRDENAKNPLGEQATARSSWPEQGRCFRPLRLTCPGGIRREKGQANYLQTVVDELWDSHFSQGKLQLIVQRPTPKWPARQHKLDLLPPVSETPTDDDRAGIEDLTNDTLPVQYVAHPLPKSDYVRLVKETDIGLLYYDSRVYFSRRAGVLGELLASGKPVIVSAGSWLSDQIEESSFSHVEQILKRYEPVRCLGVRDCEWGLANVPLPGGVVSFDDREHPFQFELERQDGEDMVALEFEWHWPKAHGMYCRLKLDQVDAAGEQVASDQRVVGFRRRKSRCNVLFRLEAETQKLCFQFTNAYDHSSASLSKLSVQTMHVGESESIPYGQVGLIAASEQDVPQCIAEMVEHYEHYRHSAQVFASRWFANHDPQLTLEHLLSVERQRQRIA